MIDAVKNNNTVLVQTGYTDVIIILEKFNMTAYMASYMKIDWYQIKCLDR